MIVYFADRQFNILGQASTELPMGLTIDDDKKTEDVETGIAVFECDILFDNATRAKAKEFTTPGNYILRSDGKESELFSITDRETDSKKQRIYIYAEDDGLDLLNEVVGAYEADQPYPLDHYITMYASGAGFEIGINEAAGLTRKLSWSGESTASARVASIAAQFDGCEISYSFEAHGLSVVKKYINIYRERGKDHGIQLRLNKEIDSIITTESVANLATALLVTGGTPDDSSDPITLLGYEYDDGDFYVDGAVLKSRIAYEKWHRLILGNQEGGHITKSFTSKATSQAILCEEAIAELTKCRDMEVNYEVSITALPDNVKIGDRVNIIDDAGELYLSTRFLKLETSRTNKEHKATLGEYLIKTSGIHQKVAEQAAQFAQTSLSATRALLMAGNANKTADSAQKQAEQAAKEAESAQTTSGDAQVAAQAAQIAAEAAQAASDSAQAAVVLVEESVGSLEESVSNAQAAADNAYTAASTAEEKAEEALAASQQAEADAAEAETAAVNAQTKADTAISKAEAAQTTADTAVEKATTAQSTADAAKADAARAQQEINELKNNLLTVTSEMDAGYVLETDFVKAKADLQSQISQNAAEIESAVSQITLIDETANNAQEQAQAAQTAADAAQSQADQAAADAQAAQTAANNAAAAATAAQNEADTAKAAAATAKSVADKAEADLEAAKADLATVTSRVNATEEEIAAAQEAVTAAQSAADKANADAQAAVESAAGAQETADTAVTNAANAKAAADDAASKANLAQQTADAAKGDAAAAQTKANEAAETAEEAQRTAAGAVTDAANAQNTANAAAQAAEQAKADAAEADSKAAQAAADLATARQNLVDVASRVDATEEEVEAAQAAVIAAQAAANRAQEEAEEAQATADTAKANAATAQATADNAKAAADNAQEVADEAQQAADEAQAAVDALAVRVTSAETKITQNSERIALLATKEEVTTTLGGFYTKEETAAAITLESDAIKSSVEETYATNERVTTAETLIQQLSNCISLLVTDENGESLMTQTENGWTFSMKETAEAVSSLTSMLDALQQQTGSTQATVDILQQAVNDQGETLEYVRVTTYEDEPCVELGESDSDFKLLTTNTRIMFRYGSNVPTLINTHGIVTQNIEVRGEIVQGGYVQLNTSDGGWGLLWKGVSG